MQNRPLAAAGAILTGMAIIGYIDQYVKIIAESSSLWTFHLMRSPMMWAMALACVFVLGKRLRVVNWRGLVARSAAMSMAMFIYFGALAWLPVAQASAGLFTSPIWVLIFSVVFFGLNIGVWRVLAVALGFTGILLVLLVDPRLSGSADAFSSWMLAPILAGAFYAVAVIATREWCPDEGALELSLAVFTMLAIGGLVVGTALTDFGPEVPLGAEGFVSRGLVWPSGVALWWTLVQAFGSLIAVFCLTRAYQLAEASHASVFEYSQLIFSSTFGFLIWGDTLGPAGWVGLALIAIAGCVIALRGRNVT